jgi:uncharacterized membrane protein YfcA
MHDFNLVLVGMSVGLMIGMTGMGGGVLLLPVLILGMHVPPLLAAGSGIVFSFFTKLGGAAAHWHRGNVDWGLTLAMAAGSVPCGLLGAGILGALRSLYGPGLNDLLRDFIGITLVVLPFAMLAQMRATSRGALALRERLPGFISRNHGAVFTGCVGGLLVGLTSIGAGSIIMLLLVLFYRITPAKMVGTDIVHGVILTGTTGLAYLALNAVDPVLVGYLLVGSVPGILVGTNLTTVVPGAWLRRILIVSLIGVGFWML